MKWGTNGVSSISTTRKDELKNYSGSSYFPAKTRIRSAEWNFIANELLLLADTYGDFWTKEVMELQKYQIIDFSYVGQGRKTTRELGELTSLELLYNISSRKNFVVSSNSLTRINLEDESVVYIDFSDENINTRTRTNVPPSPIMTSYVVESKDNFNAFTDLRTPVLTSIDQPDKFEHGDLDVELVTNERQLELESRGFIPNELIRARELNYLYNYLSTQLNRATLLDRGVIQYIRDLWVAFQYHSINSKGVGSISTATRNGSSTIHFIPSSTTFIKLSNLSQNYVQFRSIGSYMKMPINPLQSIQRLNSNTIKIDLTSQFNKVEAI